MKKTIGVLAHVDAGKTTFCEQLLLHAHALKKAGRVDHGDSFMDHDPLERERGITIFSDQACFTVGDDEWILIDTPGHMDFSSEMERAISVMDYAVLIISCVEGVQSHTQTVWDLLEAYGVPAFVFLNKTDRSGADPDDTISSIRERLSRDILDLRGAFSSDGTLSENAIEAVAENDEALMDALFSGGYDRELWLRSLRTLVQSRSLFPLMSGSALRSEGIEEFLNMLSLLTRTEYHLRTSDPFEARAARVRFDAQGNRMVFLKITGGTLTARDMVQTVDGYEKATELRVYSGAKYRQVQSASAGEIAAVIGLPGVRPGDTVGRNCAHGRFRTMPLLTTRVLFPPEIHAVKMREYLHRIEEEEPMLQVSWHEQTQSLEVQVMGQMQLEILRELVLRRFSIPIGFGASKVRYLETIASPSFGIGHYEPLRHYAEVHLKLEPAPRGSGISFESRCHVDDLALNWQRLIETHVFEYAHKGVLTGSPISDVRIILLAGRAHLKHTEGGDFREATYRAIRNALMYAENTLLEPICRFSMSIPSSVLGRVSGDLRRLHAVTGAPDYRGEDAVLEGEIPFAYLTDYYPVFTSTTHGRGTMSWQLDHYAPCENAEAVIKEAAYDPLADDTPNSVFCAKGAGYTVPWDEVRAFAHLKSEADP